MGNDYIVDEVRRIREEQAAKHNFDIRAILADAEEAATKIEAQGRFIRAQKGVDRLASACTGLARTPALRPQSDLTSR